MEEEKTAMHRASSSRFQKKRRGYVINRWREALFDKIVREIHAQRSMRALYCVNERENFMENELRANRLKKQE